MTLISQKLRPFNLSSFRSQWPRGLKAWVWGRSLAGVAGSNFFRGHGWLSVVSVVCCQVEVSATG